MKKLVLKFLIFCVDKIIVLFGLKITKFPTAKIGALIEAYFQHIYLSRSKKILFICTEEISNNYILRHVKKLRFLILILTHLYFSKKRRKELS